jgi:hypothetical protein
MHDATDGREVTIAIGGPDPLEQLIESVGVGKDVVRGLPVGVLVGIAKGRHSVRCAGSERSAEV